MAATVQVTGKISGDIRLIRSESKGTFLNFQISDLNRSNAYDCRLYPAGAPDELFKLFIDLDTSRSYTIEGDVEDIRNDSVWVHITNIQ